VALVPVLALELVLELVPVPVLEPVLVPVLEPVPPWRKQQLKVSP